MKHFISVCILICLLLSLTSCLYSQPEGDNENVFPLYTEALHSVPWNDGVIPETPLTFNPAKHIFCLEKDEYGRVMYAYKTWWAYHKSPACSSILICQQYDDQSVYYYPGVNFISWYKAPEYEDAPFEKPTLNIKKIIDGLIHAFDPDEVGFSDEEITLLKEKNDWGKPLNLEKCTTLKNEKGVSPSETEEKNLEDVIQHLGVLYADADKISAYDIRRFETDQYGRTIYFLSYSVVHQKEAKKFEASVIVYNDYSFDPETFLFVISFEDPYYYKCNIADDDAFHRFLRDNHWNEPIS